MMTNELRVRRLGWVVAASLVALLLAVVVMATLSQYHAVAKPVPAVAELAASKTVSVAEAEPGDTIAYTITVSNPGFSTPDATAWVTDVLPLEVTLLPGTLTSSWGEPPQYADGCVTWSDTLGPDAFVDITFQAEITTEIVYANIVNTAEVTGTGELLEASASTSAYTSMGDLDNPETYKEASADVVAPGDVVTFTVIIKNSEPETVYDARFTDTLPMEMAFVPLSLAAVQGEVGHANGVITWVHTLGPTAADMVEFSAVVSPDLAWDGWITNTVEIASPVQAFSREDAVYVKRPKGILESIKTVEPTGDVHVSEALSYTVVISNSGDLTVDAAEMADPLLPAKLEFVPGSLTATSGDADESGGEISWTGAIAPLEQVEIRFAAKMASSVHNGEAIVNTASITGAGAMVTAEAGVTAVTTYTYWFPAVFTEFPPGMTLNAIPAQDEDFMFEVSWRQPDYDLDDYTLEMARDESFGDVRNVWTGITGLSQDVYAYCPYYFRVRAENEAEWGHGAWSNVRRAQAAAPTPELNPIPDPDDGEYTVSWSAIPALAGWDGQDHYVLQESDDDDFDDNDINREWVVGGTSKVVPEPDEQGTWYYRVRADDADCWGEGPWSNDESVSNVDMYYDDFSDNDSGWPKKHKTVIPETNSGYHLHYEDDKYRIRIDAGGPDIWFHQPDALAPYELETDKYCVEVKVRLYKMKPPYDSSNWDFYPYWANGGLIFGANEDNTDIYAVCTSVGAEDLYPNMMGWFIVRNPDYDYPLMGCNHQDGVRGGEDAGALRVNRWHLFQVSVDGNDATVYIDGVRKGKWGMSGLRNTTRVGLIGGDYEITPTDYWFDDFRVIPDAECTPPDGFIVDVDDFMLDENEAYNELGLRPW